MYTVSEKIAELRKNKKITQEELANIVGVSAQTISKWENSQTMPDIMLLPTLASALDVTVNDLFSIVSSEDNYESISADKTPEYAYKELLKVSQQGLSNEKYISKEDVSRILGRIRGLPHGQTGLVSYENGEISGGVYVNSAIGLSFVKSKQDALTLLDDEKIAGPLTILSDANVRSVLKFMLTNGNATVTAAVVSSKCGISVSDAESALNKLCEIRMIRIQRVDTGDEKPLGVYQIFGEYKMFMAIFPLLELARLLSDWHESWIGFRC